MPYISVSANDVEIDRRELVGPIIVGRSPDCDVVVRDILLSREHCRLEPVRNRENHRWRLVDLNSRNGSHVNFKKVSDYVMVDGDVVRIGRTTLSFHTSAFTPMPESLRKQKLVRPSDPHEALSGTVSDFVYADHDASEEFDVTPSPLARSSAKDSPPSWGTNLATMARPRRLARPMPRKAGEIAVGSRAVYTDLSLQVQETPAVEVTPHPSHRWRRVMILTAALAAATALVMASGWVLTQ